MWLSCLLIDTGNNPDRPRPGRLWLRNLYHVHQRLCMAFPSKDRKAEDEQFLKPFKPDDFAQGQVHVSRAKDTGFLFRVEPQPGGRAVILVQSAIRPDWDYAFHNAGYLLAAPPDVKAFEPEYGKGHPYQFRLLANPTRRLSKHSLGADGQPVDAKDIGKRVPVRNERLMDWLVRQGEASGFAIDENEIMVQTSFVYFDKKVKEGEEPQGARMRSVRYDGQLAVSDPDKLQMAVIRGIGSGRGLGFGLLSIAPVR